MGEAPRGATLAEVYALAGEILLEDLGQPTAAYQYLLTALQVGLPPPAAAAVQRELAAIEGMQKRRIGRLHSPPPGSSSLEAEAPIRVNALPPRPEPVQRFSLHSPGQALRGAPPQTRGARPRRFFLRTRVAFTITDARLPSPEWPRTDHSLGRSRGLVNAPS